MQDLARNRNLFVCTRPYQYLICWLIRDSLKEDVNDILILNHFVDADKFAARLNRQSIWDNVYFFDDIESRNAHRGLNLFQKVCFYRQWKRYLPGVVPNWNKYGSLYCAHDGVPSEYAIIRYLTSHRVRTTIYEEGYGNYITINNHSGLMRILKRLARLIDLPGEYIGETRFVHKILLQHPEKLPSRTRKAIGSKVEALPESLKNFLQRHKTELVDLFPELSAVKNELAGVRHLKMILTESFISDQYYELAIMNLCRGRSTPGERIMVKQHPGERNRSLVQARDVLSIPKYIPVEAACTVLCTLDKLDVYTFGSTAALNLKLLLEPEVQVRIYLLADPQEVNPLADQFLTLAQLWNVSVLC